MPRAPQLGERGGGWVLIQFALIAAIVAAGLLGPSWPGDQTWLRVVLGALVALLGAAVAISSARVHEGGLTPFPRPVPSTALVDAGPYRVVRHPIYSGATLFFAGVSLVLSPAALAVTAVLGVVWALKAGVEERFLRAEHPTYAAYCEKTRFRLIPFVY